MDIGELLKSEEGKTLEFKRDLSSPKNLLKTLVAGLGSDQAKCIPVKGLGQKEGWFLALKRFFGAEKGLLRIQAVGSGTNRVIWKRLINHPLEIA